MTRSMTRWTLAGFLALAALGALAVLDVGSSTAEAAPSVIISAVTDPVGDTVPFHSTPAFQDIVFAQMTTTARGDFELQMELAGSVPVTPPVSPPAVSGFWWVWAFDLDPATYPEGYPLAPGAELWPELIVYVSWDGAVFAGTAIDRRPLLTGGEAILTPVSFRIDGTIVEADLPSELIGDVPPSFLWVAGTAARSGPVGSQGYTFVDHAEAVFNP